MTLETETNLHALLSKHAALDSPEDRLHAVLAQSADKTQSPRPRLARTLWLTGIAASFAAGIVLVQTQKNTGSLPMQAARVAPTNTAASIATVELAALMADSKTLESNLQRLRSNRARISQMHSLQQASATLATLDSQLDYWAANEPNNFAKQSALWRERVTVMHAVEDGEFHPALLLVD